MSYTHIYTGNGKGKTTCILGLALRATGANKKIYIAQFLKKGDFSEINVIKKYLSNIKLEQFGTGKFCFSVPSDEDIKCAKLACDEIEKNVTSGEYDLVLVDEINCAISLGLVSVDYALSIMENKHANTELVLTGRDAKQELIDKADLVTEMTEIKHYFNQGVKARKGIEF